MGSNIAVIGTGYVGLTTGACLSELGNKVICVDNDPSKIQKLRNYEIPIYEPGLEAIVNRNYKEKRLDFTPDIEYATKKSDIVFICVGTPPKENGEPDLSSIRNVVTDLAKVSNGYKVIVEKSTVPVQTAWWMNDLLKQRIKTDFDIAVNPEFLREGSAVYDFMNPDRIVIGTESKRAYAELAELYKPLNAPILHTDINSAEIIKHASNAMLANKISAINLIAMLCEKTNADIETVAKGVGLDKRIGPDFLKAGIGYGGFCFPKDLDAIIHIIKSRGIDAGLFEKVRDVNYNARKGFADRIIKRFGKESLEGRLIGVLGLAFKPNTDDVRLSPAIEIVKYLKNAKANIKAYDPKAMENSKNLVDIEFCRDPYEVAEKSDALVLTTDWNEFKEMDLTRIKSLMKNPPIIFDGRNIFDKTRMKLLGFEYYSIGRP